MPHHESPTEPAHEHNAPHGDESEHTDENRSAHDENESAHTDDVDKTENENNAKYEINKPHPVIGLWIYTFIQIVALILTVVATPIEMFELNTEWRNKIYPELDGTSSKKICVTAWGMKLGCRTKSYYTRDYVSSFCYRVRIDFKIVEAFVIMTIFFMTLGLFLGLLSTHQMVGKGATASIGAFAMVLAIIPWGVLAGMYYQQPCCNTANWNTPEQVKTCTFGATARNPNMYAVDVPKFKDMGKYAAGFGLLVAAWALQVIGIIFAFLPF